MKNKFIVWSNKGCHTGWVELTEPLNSKSGFLFTLRIEGATTFTMEELLHWGFAPALIEKGEAIIFPALH